LKKIEVNKLGAKNLFKVTIYLTSIPFGIMALIGVIITIIGGAMDHPMMLTIGIPYIIMPLFMIFIYGLLSMLMAVIYNLFSRKFGGLELVISEKEDSMDN
jgi:hypothetical protein